MAILNSVKAKKVMACPGSYALVAEAVLYEKGKEIYLTYQLYDTEEFTVSDDSVYKFLAEDGDQPAEITEEYLSLAQAKRESKYGNVFGMLKRLCGKLGEEVG